MEDVEFKLIEKLVAQACEILQRGERWFINKNLCASFLLAEHANPDWSKGILQMFLWSKYQDLLYFLQKYITCEDCFGPAFLFHVRILAHFYDQPLNLPYYLQISLIKMSATVKDRATTLEENLYHHVLVNIIMTKVLKGKGRTWIEFLIENYFVDIEEDLDSFDYRRTIPAAEHERVPHMCQ